MIVVSLSIVWPNGEREKDSASGNTPRMAKTAAQSLKRSYELDGAEVEILPGTHRI